ncbi:Cytochrome P450 [Colletotrichum tanaceti]|uniref:Cytochrome P450 n=1 Tax=Colletotrichum tanaceti TaxID=1306861 RepID=A0A4U6X8W0_9PEZI|nr:Cytochrome P450 [Colletotrichum tanaceti]TKW49997.1 Cytochrome P450 [Colletotrichum tanaceti]
MKNTETRRPTRITSIKATIISTRQPNKNKHVLSKMSWVLLPATFLTLFLIYLIRRRQSPDNSVQSRIRRNRGIADFSIFQPTSLQHRLQLRAGPNSRLVRAFGIRNSFTTTDVDTHTDFLRLSIHTIRSADGAAWRRVWRLANDTIEELVPPQPRNGGRREEVGIERVARILCFDAVLELLFPETRVRPFRIGPADSVTRLTNVLWQDSKKSSSSSSSRSEPGPVSRQRSLESLQEALRELVSGREGDEGDGGQGGQGSESEALGLIMPAYETLWRVVMLTYIHVAFRHIDAATRETVNEVVKSVMQNSGVGARLDPTVDNFAREALRLYPPTKRIYRASPSAEETADVESMHHDERIWGPDALEFRPNRFDRLTRDQEHAYMPFGVGKNACPAENGFGRKMISSLVVVLVTRLGTGESGAGVRLGDDDLDNDPRAPLPTGRNDAEKWVVSLGSRE